jgi:hypothetical protein
MAKQSKEHKEHVEKLIKLLDSTEFIPLKFDVMFSREVPTREAEKIVSRGLGQWTKRRGQTFVALTIEGYSLITSEPNKYHALGLAKFTKKMRERDKPGAHLGGYLHRR